MGLRLAIIGSRTFEDYDTLEAEILKNFNISEIEEVISGAAPGADRLGAQFAKKYGIKLREFPADWNNLTHQDAKIRPNKWGKLYDANAGFRRNKDIIDASDVVIAFTNGSRGTQHSINLALQSHKKVILVSF
jgi:hypothetical protein